MKIILSMVLCLFCNSLLAQNIKLVVPFAAGGYADQMARVIQNSLSSDLKANVIIEIKPGAAGEIGSASVANSNSKDLVLLLNGSGLFINGALKERTAFKETDLVPLIHTGYVPFVIVVSKKSGIKNFKDLQNLNNDRTVTFGSSGIGSSTHLAGEILKQNVKKNLTHVPYKGAAQAIPDLISGHIDMLIIHWTAVLPYILSEQIIPLAIDADNRIPKLPEVPALTEFDMSLGKDGYLVLFANKDSDPVLQEKVKKSVLDMMKNSSETSNYRVLGTMVEKNALDVQKFVDNEREKYNQILNQIKLE